MTPPGRSARRALGQPWEDDLVRDGLRAALDAAELANKADAWALVARAGTARERWWIPAERSWFAYGATADLPGSEPYALGEAPARAWAWKRTGGELDLPTYQGLSGEAAAERPLDWADPLMTDPGRPYTDDYYVGLNMAASLYGAWRGGQGLDPAAAASAQLVPWLGDDPWARLKARGWNSVGMDAPLVWWLERKPWATLEALRGVAAEGN